MNSKQIYAEYQNNVTAKFSIYSLMLYRTSRLYGLWAEAYPDSPPREKNSYISYTNWNSDNNSILTYQNFDWKVTSNFQLLGGLKYEGKRLTKSYDIPGYYDSFSSYPYLNDPKIFPNGFGVGYSTDPLYLRPPDPKSKMPSSNTINTQDVGGFFSTIYTINKFRFSPGIRYDRNSEYGQSINPRITGIYYLSSSTTIKLLYGEAFNEPSPLQVYGGWNGRNANPNLKPEKERSHELIVMHQTQRFFHDASIYYSRYENVIKEEAENAGSRKIYGFEYKLKTKFDNFIPNSLPIEFYFNYTFTEALSSIYYDHREQKWKEGSTFLRNYEYQVPQAAQIPRDDRYYTLGDIARHKFQLGLNLPVGDRINWNLRGYYVGKKTLYLHNALREEGKTISPHFIINTTINYDFKQFGYISLKILNVLNHTYYHPGVEGAGAGDNYYERAKAFQNSLLPQAGRYFQISWNLEF